MNLKVIKLIRKNRVLLAANAKHVHLMICIKIHDLSGALEGNNKQHTAEGLPAPSLPSGCGFTVAKPFKPIAIHLLTEVCTLIHALNCSG